MERCEDGSRLGVSIFKRQLSKIPDLCSNSSVCKISEETLPYMSGIFDDTVDPSFTSDGPPITVDLPECSPLKTLKSQDQVNPELRSQSKTIYSSWLSAPVENGHAIDLSMSFTSPQKDKQNVTNVTETSPKAGTPDLSLHCKQSTSCTEQCEEQTELNNSTFDMTKDLKEKSSGLNCTVSLPCVSTESNNVTFEKTLEQKEMSTPGLSSSNSTENVVVETALEKNLDSTVDICGPSETSTEKPSKKFDHTVDIERSQSDVPNEEQCTEGLAASDDCEKHGTFTKTSEETSVNVTSDVLQNVTVSVHISPKICEPSSDNGQPVDGTFTKYNTTTDVVSEEPLPSPKDSNVNVTKPLDTELQVKCDADGGAVVDNPLAKPLPQLCVGSVPVTLNAEVPICSDRTLDLPEAESKIEEHQAFIKRKNGVSEQECQLNLDISQSSMFSLDDTLEMKSRILVTSTPIVLGRGFDRLRCAQYTDMQKRLSVINSIDSQSNDDLVGVREHDGSDPSETNPSSVKSETCSQTQTKVSAKCTPNSSASESAVVNKPPSKAAARRKIPQLFCKSSIPKTQLLPRPSISHGASVAVKSKIEPAVQAPSQPEMSSSALRSTRRTVQLNKGKSLVPAKNTLTAGNISSVATSTSGCTLKTDSKPATTVTQAKASGLQPPGRGRFGLKPPGVVVFSAETGHSQTHNKPNGLSGVRTRSSLLPGFAQKHASSGALPLAKRKRIDGQEKPSCAEAPTSSKPGVGAQGPVTAPKDIKPKKTNTDCGNCTLLREKLQTFHQELGGFLQEFKKIPAGCENWLPFQQKFEECLQEFKRLQAGHQ